MHLPIERERGFDRNRIGLEKDTSNQRNQFQLKFAPALPIPFKQASVSCDISLGVIFATVEITPLPPRAISEKVKESSPE